MLSFSQLFFYLGYMCVAHTFFIWKTEKVGRCRQTPAQTCFPSPPTLLLRQQSTGEVEKRRRRMARLRRCDALVLVVLAVASPCSFGATRRLQPREFSPFTTTVPALPVAQPSANLTTCHLDLSDELFGGVSLACSGPLDRSRCCPVLASWLFAAHARSALSLPGNLPQPAEDDGISPMMPDDSQRCVDALQASLHGRHIRLARPNASCDAVLCFCGIRLHHLTSLRCPAAFNLSLPGDGDLATPTRAVRSLESNCRNATYAGCTRCLRSLQKLKGENGGSSSSRRRVGGEGDRASKMFGRDCQLMGLTWLLQRNKTTYIPTVSAVLRALLYSAHPLESEDEQQPEGPRCSPDQENMPLAVNSLEFEKLGSSVASRVRLMELPLAVGVVVVAVVVVVITA